MQYDSTVVSDTDARFSHIPLHAKRKNPQGNWKQFQTEKADSGQVQIWRDQGLNLGVVTGPISGVVVIDLDSPEAIAIAQKKGLPPTPAVKTPRGEHHYFRCPDDPPKNGVSVLDGIDFRGEGGYVVAAGSTFEPTEKELAEGKIAGLYEWIEGTENLPFADLPAWFVEAQDARKPKTAPTFSSSPSNQKKSGEYGRKALDSEIAILKTASEGGRNHQLNRSAFALGQLVASGDLDERATGFALMAAALDIGLDEEEASKTIESGLVDGMAHPRAEQNSPFTITDSSNASRVLQKVNQQTTQFTPEQAVKIHNSLPTVWEGVLSKIDPEQPETLAKATAQLISDFQELGIGMPRFVALVDVVKKHWDEDTIETQLHAGCQMFMDFQQPKRASNGLSKTASSDKFTMINFADTEAVLDGKWLIKGVFPSNGITCTFGHPGTMKSFLMLDMALHVALGWDWMGRKTERGLVIYIAAEGATGMKNRIVAFRDAHNVQEAPPFVLIPCPVNMRDGEADMPKLVRSIESAIVAHGSEPAMIVIDTLAKTFGSGEENGSDMVAYMSNSEVIAAEFDCLINIVHHRPKEETSKEPRGHSSLRGGVETLLLLEGKPEVRAEIVKQKDGAEGRLCSFKLNQVVLGEDSDGELVTSAVIEKTEYREPAFLDRSPRDKARYKLSDQHKIALNCLGEELEQNGLSVPKDIPEDHIGKLIGKVVAFDTWSDRFFTQYFEGGTDSDKKPDSARKAFDRAIKSLQSKDIIGVYEDYAWIK